MSLNPFKKLKRTLLRVYSYQMAHTTDTALMLASKIEQMEKRIMSKIDEEKKPGEKTNGTPAPAPQPDSPGSDPEKETEEEKTDSEKTAA